METNTAFVLGAVARMTADIAIQAVRDQNTARSQTCELSAPGVLLMGTLTSPFIPFSQKAISKDVQPDREKRDGEKVHVRMPRRELHRVIRPGNNGSGDESGFVGEVLSFNRSSEREIQRCLHRHSPPKTASIVTSVNQPAMLIHPRKKL